ncbi:hypothetical protein A2797_01320 [candidate division WWE3 bacterium RIFCSPHIGHO2_01_FULL_48_15]|uniref:DUF1003 domain-containing protein n=1 Tax=candidate division WWE3 bacterium RIFCSPHIGHO2_01_FULL_48_15 TaxID=1802619 RepID=A0A1F4VGX2_UNCKA|nr:MAG: hypothetical protein A2797_01320 [candidate division WWE3 bacterium RIFCSPHIGHO2_01_FULL_48_15]
MPGNNGRSRRQLIEAFETKARAKRTWVQKLEDKITSTFGTFAFLFFNLAFFAFWFVINSNLFPGIKPFDPYPYVMLITIVSLEAIILSVFVLITQKRQAKIDDLRDEIELQVNLTTEKEITKVLRILTIVLGKMGVDAKKDPELRKMARPIDTEEIERQLEEQLKEE